MISFADSERAEELADRAEVLLDEVVIPQERSL
jgi:hypothetical protein